jgi:lycopene beta-cyclase
MHTNSVVSRFEPNPQAYDYIFCGLGASASLLILALHRKNLLKYKKVLLIDQVLKNKKDKTFCFWAQNDEPITIQLEALISKAWNKVSLSSAHAINIAPLSYYHVDSIDLYEQVQSLANFYQWDKIIGEVNTVSNDGISPNLIVNQTKFSAQTIFDSRTPNSFPLQKDQTHIHQSFVGWLIETEQEVLNPDEFKFMDFEIAQQGYTQFVYVLPFSSSKALVEVTRFGDKLIQINEAEEILENYIESAFGSFKKLAIETGCIPMSNGAVDNAAPAGIVNLGARNYHIKPSTGYAFKNMFYHALKLAETIEQNGNPSLHNHTHAKAFKGKFSFYDSLLLAILKNNPSQGKSIFTTLLTKVPIQKTLKFLDEETSLREDISIFYKLPWTAFLKALFGRTASSNWFQPLLLSILTILLLTLGVYPVVQKDIGYLLLVAGLVLVGIPHGAVDHLLETGSLDFKKAPIFIAKYLFWIALMAAVWIYLPTLALVCFIIYSAWHFGETDAKSWGLSPILSMLWGSSVLLYILGTHTTETNVILSSMDVKIYLPNLPVWSLLPWAIWGIRQKQIGFILTLIWLSLSSALPLLFSFGIYFIGQHSINGWKHIQLHLKVSHFKIWLQALPFHAGAWLLLAIFYFYWPMQTFIASQSPWGLFFIFIACLSFPHVIVMHLMYRKK